MISKPYVLLFFLLLSLLIGCRPDPCANLDCQNGGVCIDGACECPDGFIGPECVTELDPCILKQCLGAQTESCTLNDDNEAVCNCKDGFEGELCDDLWTEKFSGEFNCIEECDGNSILFPVRIEEGPEFKRITIINFHNAFDDSLMLESKLVAELINPTVLEINDQFMKFGLVEGSGLMQNEDLIILNYSITTETDTLACIASIERK